MGKGLANKDNNNRLFTLRIILHQASFLVTGLCTTLGVQWLFYRGAATSMSLLPQLSSYTGMLFVGLFIPILLKTKREQVLKEYRKIEATSEADYKVENDEQERVLLDRLQNPDNEEQLSSPIALPSCSNLSERAVVFTFNNNTQPVIGADHSSKTLRKDTESTPAPYELEQGEYMEGPIPHFSILKLASLDILASFALTVGFSVIGSGMYQVIYSSVVVWCAILTYVFMGRALNRLQWLAIAGTSIGLGISSLDSIRSAPFETDKLVLLDENQQLVKGIDTSNKLLLNGTLMTLGGTFISACIYVYADSILSKSKAQPLPARVCVWMGLYTSFFTWIWIAFYTLPQWKDIIHINYEQTSLTQVGFVYAIVTVANAVHSYNYYELIDATGNVATGILQGLRAILVYGLSHIWYCREDAAQCFTESKGLGSFIVIACVLMFTLGKN